MEKKKEISRICDNIKTLVSCIERDIEDNNIKEIERDKSTIEYLLKELYKEIEEQKN